jgi:hypothetical protein
VIFRDGPHGPFFGRFALNEVQVRPASVFSEDRFEVGVLVIVESDVRRVRIVIRSDDATDVRHVGDAGKLLDLAPVLAAVFGDLQQTVVSADVNQTVFLLRLGECRSIAEESVDAFFATASIPQTLPITGSLSRSSRARVGR